jgi:Tfp pilus assembly protein PilO
MKSFGRRATIAVAAVACLAVLVGGWFLLIQPTRSSISKTKAQTAQQEQDNQSAQLQLQTMRSIAKNLPVEKAELAALQKKVPDQVELPTILRSMQFLAVASGVKLLSITPTTPTALDNAPGISSVTVQLSVSGGYAEIEQFDSALEGLQRTFLVSGFTVTGGAVGSGSSSSSSPSGSSSSASSANEPVTITANLTGRVLVHTTATAATTKSSTATGTSGH